jgi:hypothetical protein
MGLLGALLKMLRKEQENPSVQETVLRAVATMSKLGECATFALGCVICMFSPFYSPLHLLPRTEDNEVYFGEHDAIPCVIATTSMHLENEYVAAQALRCVHALCLTRNENRLAFGDNGMIDHIVHLMKGHSRTHAVQRFACEALERLAQDGEEWMHSFSFSHSLTLTHSLTHSHTHTHTHTHTHQICCAVRWAGTESLGW